MAPLHNPFFFLFKKTSFLLPLTYVVCILQSKLLKITLKIIILSAIKKYRIAVARPMQKGDNFTLTNTEILSQSYLDIQILLNDIQI